MIEEVGGWVEERWRKGLEFEVEGWMAQAVMERGPHACMALAGCGLMGGRVAMGGAVVAIVVIVIAWKRHHAKRNPKFDPFDVEV